MALLLDNVHRKGDGIDKNMTFFALVCILLWRFSFGMLTIGIRAKTFWMMDDEGSKNDFGPAKPEGRSQTRPVEALISFSVSAVFSYGALQL